MKKVLGILFALTIFSGIGFSQEFSLDSENPLNLNTLELTGAYWKSLSAEEKEVFLDGFFMGIDSVRTLVYYVATHPEYKSKPEVQEAMVTLYKYIVEELSRGYSPTDKLVKKDPPTRSNKEFRASYVDWLNRMTYGGIADVRCLYQIILF